MCSCWQFVSLRNLHCSEDVIAAKIGDEVFQMRFEGCEYREAHVKLTITKDALVCLH